MVSYAEPFDLERKDSLTPPSQYYLEPLQPLFPSIAPDMAILASSQRSSRSSISHRPAFIPRSSQRNLPAGPSSSPSQRSQPSVEIAENHTGASDIDSNTQDDDDHGDFYTDLLIEARDTYTDKEPPFLVSHPGAETTRTVRLEDNRTGEIHFEEWNVNNNKGFWTLNDDKGQKYILKYFSKGHRYCAWMGIAREFEEKAVALPKASPKATSNAITRDWEGEEYTEQSPAPAEAAHGRLTLRERSQKQLNPYQADKFQHERAKAGKPKLEFGSLGSPVGTRTKRAAAASTDRNKRQRTMQESESRTMTPSGTPQELSDIEKYHQTKLYTRLQSDPMQPVEVIHLEDAITITGLFSKIRQAWDLNEETKVKLAVTFPWLPEGRRIVSVRPNRPESVDYMLEEVRRAPCWEEEQSRCELDGEVITA